MTKVTSQAIYKKNMEEIKLRKRKMKLNESSDDFKDSKVR